MRSETLAPRPPEVPAVTETPTFEICVGKSRRQQKYHNMKVTWEWLVRRFRETVAGSETAAGWEEMTKDQQGGVKDVGAYIGGHLEGGVRKGNRNCRRSLVALDYDDAIDPEELWERVTKATGGAWALMHSTRSHTPDKPRLRVVVPLDGPHSPDRYQAVARTLAADIGAPGIDPSTFELTRVMYWPSHHRDVEPVFRVIDDPEAGPVDTDRLLERYRDPRDCSEWPLFGSETEPPVTAASAAARGLRPGGGTMEDPLRKEGLIGAFCRAHTIEDAIRTWLGGVYVPGKGGRWTYAAGKTSNGLVVYDGRWAYSNHATDPAHGTGESHLRNAWDLVRVHLYGEGPEAERRMRELAANDAATSEQRAVDVASDFDDITEADLVPFRAVPEAKAWQTRLTRDKRDAIESTIPNIETILDNDPALEGHLRLNRFTARLEASGELPWPRPGTGEVGDQWTDRDDAALRGYLERHYRISAPAKVMDALNIVSARHAYHPVLDYFGSLTWDGVPRMERCIIHALGAEDTELNRRMTAIWLMSSVARIYQTGAQVDQCLILQGDEGSRKTTFFRIIGGDWVNESRIDIESRDGMEALRGKQIVVFDELQSLNRKESAAIKNFLTKRVDSYRQSYGRRSNDIGRQCVFAGTTNDDKFLKGTDGNRRFFFIKVDPALKGAEDTVAWLTANRDQIWAEAVATYAPEAAEHPKLWLEGELDRELKEAQKDVNSDLDDPNYTAIGSYLDLELPDGWEAWDPERRMRWVRGDQSREFLTGRTRRRRVCSAEILRECFGKGAGDSGSKELHNVIRGYFKTHKAEWRYSGKTCRFPGYGSFKYWERVGCDDEPTADDW